MDYLEIADTLIRETRGEQTPQVDAAIAQAAALIALVEQAKRIADALNSIDTVLVDARGPMGAINVYDTSD